MEFHSNNASSFIAGLIVGSIGALCAIKIYNDDQEIHELQQKVEELTTKDLSTR